MVVAASPPQNPFPTILFIILAAIITTVVTYKTNKYLEKNAK